MEYGKGNVFYGRGFVFYLDRACVGGVRFLLDIVTSKSDLHSGGTVISEEVDIHDDG